MSNEGGLGTVTRPAAEDAAYYEKLPPAWRAVIRDAGRKYDCDWLLEARSRWTGEGLDEKQQVEKLKSIIVLTDRQKRRVKA